MILPVRCNLERARTRVILSTFSVDNSEGNFVSCGNFPCLQQASLICFFFGQNFISLILLDKFYDVFQNTENIGNFLALC